MAIYQVAALVVAPRLNEMRKGAFHDFYNSRDVSVTRACDWLAHKTLSVISLDANLIAGFFAADLAILSACTLGAFKVGYFVGSYIGGNSEWLRFETGYDWCAEKCWSSFAEIYEIGKEFGREIVLVADSVSDLADDIFGKCECDDSDLYEPDLMVNRGRSFKSNGYELLVGADMQGLYASN